MNALEISDLVRQERKKKKLSQEALGKKVNLSRKTISDIENGLRHVVGFQHLLKIFRELDLVIDVKPFSRPTINQMMARKSSINFSENRLAS